MTWCFFLFTVKDGRGWLLEVQFIIGPSWNWFYFGRYFLDCLSSFQMARRYQPDEIHFNYWQNVKEQYGGTFNSNDLFTFYYLINVDMNHHVHRYLHTYLLIEVKNYFSNCKKLKKYKIRQSVCTYYSLNTYFLLFQLLSN